MRKARFLVWCALILLAACQRAESVEEQVTEEKSCACHEPNALNAVSIDFPPEMEMDRILGDSVQNSIVYRLKHDFIQMTVRCGACDTLTRKPRTIQKFLPPLLRDKGRKAIIRTKKYEGGWYEAEENGRWNCEFFLNGKGPKQWYVQITAQSVDSSIVRIIREAIPTIEIREKANAH